MCHFEYEDLVSDRSGGIERNDSATGLRGTQITVSESQLAIPFCRVINLADRLFPGAGVAAAEETQ